MKDTDKDWLEDVIEENTLGKPIVQVERLKYAIRQKIEELQLVKTGETLQEQGY